MNDEEWTLVESNKNKRIKKNIEKDIHDKVKENKIVNIYPNVFNIVNHDIKINSEILEDNSYLDYIKKTYIFNRNIRNSSRLLKIDKLVIESLTRHFMDKTINILNYNKIIYSNNSNLDKLDSIRLKRLLNMFKIRIKNNNSNLILVYSTDNKELPYGLITYTEYTDTDISNEELVLFSNYYELVLYLFMCEIKLQLKKPTLLIRYPVNFEKITKNNLDVLFSNFNKVWK